MNSRKNITDALHALDRLEECLSKVSHPLLDVPLQDLLREAKMVQITLENILQEMLHDAYGN